MTSVNPNCYANCVKTPAFKANEKNKAASATTNPVPQPNVSFKGTEALAAYNYAKINKDNFFNFPTIKPLDIPKSIDEIKGEQITNSKGELVRIINEDDSQKTQYYFVDNKLWSLTKLEKDTGIKWVQGFPQEENETICIEKKYPDGKNFGTLYKNGKPTGYWKNINYPNGDNLSVDYDTERKEYYISKHYNKDGHQYSSFATFDENKKCIDAHESRGIHDKHTNLYFKDGIPYEMTTTESKIIPQNIGKEDLNLTNLEPDKPLDINLEEAQFLEGQKKYFSNGQIEEIITPNGNIYKFNLEGLESVKIREKEYFFDRDDDNKFYKWEVITNLDNGIKKRTYSWNDNGNVIVSIEKNNKIIKDVTYNKNGIIKSFYDKEAKISREYDENGNLMKIWDQEMVSWEQ